MLGQGYGQQDTKRQKKKGKPKNPTATFEELEAKVG